ncbi:uncharacterized protein BDV14DRAFT_9356 [Aspergillus stella-maris]|uniref:uncharacterized protein n=1 Tax=Aspergillus stella-maris TaxID=1810926 RepID=UPI003CCCBE1A
MAEAEEEQRALRRTMQDMHHDEEQAWLEEIARLDRQFRRVIAEIEEEIQELEESIWSSCGHAFVQSCEPLQLVYISRRLEALDPDIYMYIYRAWFDIIGFVI